MFDFYEVNNQPYPVSLTEIYSRSKPLLGYARICQILNIDPLRNIQCHCIAENWSEYRKKEPGIVKIMTQNIKTWDHMDIAEHLYYAIANEDLNPYIISKLFSQIGSKDRNNILRQMAKHGINTPASRKLGYLFEKFTGRDIPLKPNVIDGKRGFTRLLNPARFYTIDDKAAMITNKMDFKFRVIDNTLGDLKTLCPTVRRSDKLAEFAEVNYNHVMTRLLRHLPEKVSAKTIEMIFANESYMSFKIENEEHERRRIAIYRDLLKEYRFGIPYFSKQFLIKVQNQITDKESHNSDYRNYQNFVGIQANSTEAAVAAYLPPQAEDVNSLMDGTFTMHRMLSNCTTIDPVIAGAVMHGAFVAIHPFSDGNGRISRLLIHDMLARHKYGYQSTVFPISDAINSNRLQYVDGLDGMLDGIIQRCDKEVGANNILKVDGNDPDLYRYLDMTPFVECIYYIMKRSVEKTVPNIIHNAKISVSMEEIFNKPCYKRITKGQRNQMIYAVAGAKGQLKLTKRRIMDIFGEYINPDILSQLQAEIKDKCGVPVTITEDKPVKEIRQKDRIKDQADDIAIIR